MNNGNNGTNGNNGHRDARSGGDSSSRWPDDVGIVGMEVYFPNQYVDQAEYEQV